MTQLVELQKHIEQFEAAGIKVYAISYDSPEDLKTFATKYGITYDLLSDEDSAVIKEFGILNTLFTSEDAGAGRFLGIPFPGTYVTDSGGVVAEKFFNRHYATRASAGTILDTALGQVLIHQESPLANQRGERATITAFLSDENLKLEVASTLHVRIAMAKGLHAYAEPLPEGFFPTKVTLKPMKGLRIGEPVYPGTEPRRFGALDVTLNVYEDVVEIAIPVTATAEVLNWGQERTVKALALEVVVSFQACSDETCFAPESLELTLDVPLGEVVLPNRARR